MAKTNAKSSALKQGTLHNFFGVAKGSGVQKPKAPKPSRVGNATKAAAAVAASQSGSSQDDSQSQVGTLFSASGETPVASQDTDITEPYIGEEEVVRGPSSAQTTWASILNGFTAPTLRDGGFETIGEGPYQVTLHVKTLPQKSSKFFEGPIPHVDKSDKAVTRFRKDAEKYTVIRDSTVVRCADGKPLLYFVKAGMLKGLSEDEKRDLPEQSVNAIRDLTKAYPPTPPKKGDSRLQAEQMEIQAAKHEYFGRYMFTFWHPEGAPHKPPRISEQSLPKDGKAMEQIVQYMSATKWEHAQVARWISIIDPQIHEELHACYQKLGEEKLKHLYHGPEACHSGLALLINRTEGPHKDSNDARDNWTATNCWSTFTDGCVAYPDLGIKIAQEPGDITLGRAAVLTHFVEDITSGERLCHVRFTKKDILRPSGKVYQAMGLRCPIEGCARICISEDSLKKHLRGPTDKASREKRSSTYHWLEKEEVKRYIAKAWRNKSAEEEAGVDVDMSEA